MNAKEDRQGGCWCGAVRYRVAGPLGPVTFCHCSQCVRTHGHVAAFLPVPREGFELLADASLQWHRCSDIARRAFCGECGSRLFWQADDDTEIIEIVAGSLDRHDGLQVGEHTFVSDKPSYYEIGDSLPQRAQR